MSIKSIVVMACMFTMANFNANAEGGMSAQEIMSISKITGACGIFRQMANFQEATQLSGGNEFSTRFLLAEAARLGLTSEDYIKRCNEMTAMYTKLWAALEKSEKK